MLAPVIASLVALAAVPLGVVDGPPPPSPRIVNGIPTSEWPTVGHLWNDGLQCSGVLIGCRTFLTAAHCVCTDPATGTTLPGHACLQRPDLLDPSNKSVFLQHAGRFPVGSVQLPEHFAAGIQGDLAVVRLVRPVEGVRPSRVAGPRRVEPGTIGAIVGFGTTQGGRSDAGIKRQGAVVTVGCTDVPPETHLCWSHRAPPGAPGFDSNTCLGDSGGPLFVVDAAGPAAAAVATGGRSASCLASDRSWSTDLAVEADWLAAAIGDDETLASCGPWQPVGTDGSLALGADASLVAAAPEAIFTVEVPAGTAAARFSVNGADPAQNELALAVRPLGAGSPGAGCTGAGAGSLQACEVLRPAAGRWEISVALVSGTGGPVQVNVTLLTARPDPPPAGPWVAAAGLSGLRFKATVAGGPALRSAAGCPGETLCFGGAVPGRVEVMIRSRAPRRAAGRQVMVVRFTPAPVDVWILQDATGEVRVMRLPPAREGSLTGLVDAIDF